MENQKIVTIAITGHRPGKLPCGYAYLPEQSVWAKRFFGRMVNGLMKFSAKYGHIRVLSGMALGVDQLFALAALEAKKQGADLELTACVPCHNYSRKWRYENKRTYDAILKEADSVEYVVDGEYTADCLELRNRYMVDRANLLLAVWDGSRSGTANCVRYAESKGVKVQRITPAEV